MKGRSALATLIACTLLAPVSAAWAQDDEEGASEEGATEEGATEEGATEEGAAEEGATEEGAEEAAAAPTGRWPRAVIARPLTLPKSLAQVGADITANNDFKEIALALVGGYGISDDLELTAFYSYALKEFEIKGSLDVDVGYKVLRGAMGGKLEVIARGRAGYNVLGEGLNPLRLGAQAQYNISDKLAVITPGGQLSIALEEVGVDPNAVRPISLALPVAVGYQVTPELYVQADTTVFSLEIADSPTTVIFADTTPIQVTGIYNVMPALDVLAALKLDLTPPDPAGVGDTLNFIVGARYYLGAL
jgi:hypothetical protein